MVQGDATIVHTVQMQRALQDLKRRQQSSSAPAGRDAPNPYVSWMSGGGGKPR